MHHVRANGVPISATNEFRHYAKDCILKPKIDSPYLSSEYEEEEQALELLPYIKELYDDEVEVTIVEGADPYLDFQHQHKDLKGIEQ